MLILHHTTLEAIKRDSKAELTVHEESWDVEELPWLLAFNLLIVLISPNVSLDVI
jgi:hypothetical protein